MSAESDAETAPSITDADVARFQAMASVLETIDETEDIALEIYRRPLDPEVGARAAEFFQSERWSAAISKRRECGDGFPQDGR